MFRHTSSEVSLLKIKYFFFQHASYCHVCHCSLCLTSYLATMAKEKEFLQHLGNCFVACWPEGTFYDVCLAKADLLGPSYMISDTRDNLPPKTTLSSVYMWKRRLCRPRRSWPCMIILNLYWKIKCTDSPLCLSFPRSPDHRGFCRVKFHLFGNDFCFWGNLHS